MWKTSDYLHSTDYVPYGSGGIYGNDGKTRLCGITDEPLFEPYNQHTKNIITRPRELVELRRRWKLDFMIKSPIKYDDSTLTIW